MKEIYKLIRRGYVISFRHSESIGGIILSVSRDKKGICHKKELAITYETLRDLPEDYWITLVKQSFEHIKLKMK